MVSNVNIKWGRVAGVPFCEVSADSDVIGRLEATMIIDAYNDVRIDAVSYIQQSVSMARGTAVNRVNRIMAQQSLAAPYYSVKHGRDKNRLDYRASTPFLLLQETLEGFKYSPVEHEAAAALRVMRDAVKASPEAQDKKFWVNEKFLSPYKGLGAHPEYKAKGGESLLNHDAEEPKEEKEEAEIVLPDLSTAEKVDVETDSMIAKLGRIESIIRELKGLAKEIDVQINISIKG